MGTIPHIQTSARARSGKATAVAMRGLCVSSMRQRPGLYSDDAGQIQEPYGHFALARDRLGECRNASDAIGNSPALMM